MFRLARANQILYRLTGADEVLLFFLEQVLAIVIVVFICRLAVVRPRTWRSIRRELLISLGLFIALGLLAVAIRDGIAAAPEVARRSQCSNNLKQIAVAMQAYHGKYGCFPPAYTVDGNGRPLHSWRVLLLPFLDQNPLYGRIRLDEPYDGPHNGPLFESLRCDEYGHSLSMPGTYSCPSDRDDPWDTNYVMVVGPQTISNGPNAARLTDITDGASNTIAAVETYGLGIHWYEPKDARAEEMSFKINDPEYIGIASRHPGGAQVVFADTSVRFLPENFDRRVVEAMTTINGKEEVSPPK